MLSSYSRAFLAHAGNAADKWEQYLPVYDGLLRELQARRSPVRVLEIGVQNGGSLQVLASLLPPGSSLLGIDINPHCRTLDLGPGIEVVTGDAGGEDLPALVKDRVFDLIIDDGSHRSADVIAAFRMLFEHLSEGGVYVVEDTHASYWRGYGGGLQAEGSSIAFFKTLIDVLHQDHMEPEDRAASGDAFVRYGGRLARVEFRDSIVVVEKRGGPPAPARRVLTGGIAPVADPIDYFIARGPRADVARAVLAPAAAARMSEAFRHRMKVEPSKGAPVTAAAFRAWLEGEVPAVASSAPVMPVRHSRLRRFFGRIGLG